MATEEEPVPPGEYTPATETAPPSSCPTLRYTVESTSFAGKTIKSLYQLNAGTAVFGEQAIFIVKPHPTPRSTEGPLERFEPGIGAIEKALNEASSEDQEEFWKLSNAHKTVAELRPWVDAGLLEGRENDEKARRMLGIWKTNCWAPHPELPWGIYLKYSVSRAPCLRSWEARGADQYLGAASSLALLTLLPSNE